MSILEKTTREKQELMDKSLHNIKSEYNKQLDLYIKKEKEYKKRLSQLELLITNNRSSERNILEDKQLLNNKINELINENKQLKNEIISRDNKIQSLNMDNQNLYNNIKILKVNLNRTEQSFDSQLDAIQIKSKETIISLRNQIELLQNELIKEQKRSKSAEDMLRKINNNLKPTLK